MQVMLIKLSNEKEKVKKVGLNYTSEAYQRLIKLSNGKILLLIVKLWSFGLNLTKLNLIYLNEVNIAALNLPKPN